ncbi:hypothetical protein L1987_63781 [Smallanthus sonchifolius]|uniref:Uncharacterized protein n=1 Tax=Smallanthus sonchifolius TaxID=185202 RepID=A0ACB9CEG7_9ASTR|nr:hypothetical protein L1987_63781 [Smallanthus sonchifolius]
MGLALFWKFYPYDVNWLLVVTLILLSLGTSGDKILQDVLQDLLYDIDKSQDRSEKRSIARATIWSRIAQVSAAVSTILWVAPGATGGVHPSWTSSFFVCIITMTLAVIISAFGHNVYHQGELTERPVEVFFGVFQARIKMLLKHISGYFLFTFSSYDNFRTLYSYIEPFKNVSNVGVFFVVSIISATGSALFLQQFNNLHADNDIAVQIYSLVQGFSQFAIPYLCRWICCLRKNEKTKIGVGMVCGIISCIFAWQLEIFRLKEVRLLDNEEDTNTSISFLWLVPQFGMLGCMERLTGEGLLKFYKSQLKEEQLQGYREEYIEFVMGIGKLLNIFLILTLQGWFGVTINDSRLDKYYLVLVCVGSENFITYCCIARFFYKDRELANDDDSANDDLQDQLTEQIRDIEQNQDLANDDLQNQLMEQIIDIEQNQDLAIED